MDTKQKYIRLGTYGQIIIFPCSLQHDIFRYLKPVSAGFCYVNAQKKQINCFGESISLGLESNPEDTLKATQQIFGIDACGG